MARLKAPTSIGDVDIDPRGPLTGQALVYDGTKFKPGDVATDPGVTDHSDLTGVTASQHHARYTDAEAVIAVGTPWVGLYLPLSGGSLSNFLTLHANPSSAMHASTKQYVDAAVAGAQGIPHYVQPTAPGSPVDGALWTNPDESAVIDPAYPKGILAFAIRTSASGGLAANTTYDIVSCPSITVPAGRRLRITILMCFRNAGAGQGNMNVLAFRGATQLHRTYDSLIDTGMYQTNTFVTWDNPPAGSYVYKFQARMDAQAWDLIGDPYAYISVEDVGLAF